MRTETVVADTSMTILPNGDRDEHSSQNKGNQKTQVDGTRVNRFWNTVQFSDQRVGPTSRQLKIETKAYNDVTGQTQSDKINRSYDPPFTLVITEFPKTDATIEYTGQQTHNVHVVTHYQVLKDGDEEFGSDLGEYTIVEET